MTTGWAERAVLIITMIATTGQISACTEQSSSQPPPTTLATATTTPPETGPTSSQPGQSQPGPSQPAPSPTGEQPCGPPVLRILAPADGSRVHAPFPITYEVRCFPVERDGTIVAAVDGMRIDLHPQASSGTVTVPDHPLLSGQRTVIFQLAARNGQSFSNPDASVTRQLTITGRR